MRREKEVGMGVTLQRLWSVLLWIVGPWAGGFLVVIAVAASRLLLTTGRLRDPLDAYLFGVYGVIPRTWVVLILAVAIVCAALIVFALAKNAAK